MQCKYQIYFHYAFPQSNLQICDRTFSDDKFLEKHLKETHFGNFEDLNDIDRKHYCTICSKRYKQNKLLVIHMRTHTGERPFSCEICGRSFALSSSLRKHRNIHSTEKKYTCSICGRKFNQNSNLAAHLKTHTGKHIQYFQIKGKVDVNRDSC